MAEWPIAAPGGSSWRSLRTLWLVVGVGLAAAVVAAGALLHIQRSGSGPEQLDPLDEAIAPLPVADTAAGSKSALPYKPPNRR